MTDTERRDDDAIEERLARLSTEVERLRRHLPSRPPVMRLHPAGPLALGLAALVCGYLGLGLPQHYYQPLFAGLFLLLAYHREVWHMRPHPWRWPLVVMNFLLLCLLCKLLIGGGMQYPFDWLKVPTFQQVPSGDDSWYRRVFPDYQLSWQGVPGISDWYINMTKIQTLLLVATLAGALFRFQPFASFTALALLVLSVPSYLAFNWDWVILFLVLGGTALYLQSAAE